jgi:hypothetical protein
MLVGFIRIFLNKLSFQKFGNKNRSHGWRFDLGNFSQFVQRCSRLQICGKTRTRFSWSSWLHEKILQCSFQFYNVHFQEKVVNHNYWYVVYGIPRKEKFLNTSVRECKKFSPNKSQVQVQINKRLIKWVKKLKIGSP